MPASVLLLLALAAAPARAQLVVTDPAHTAVSQLQLQVTQLHTAFMKLQLVQDAVMLKNNYLQTKEYYDTIYAHSQHRGGLMGYYKDYFDQEFQNLAADQWRQMNLEASSITGDTAVGRLVAEASASVGDATGRAINGAGGAVGSGMDEMDTGYKGARGLLFQQKRDQVAAVDRMTAASEARADETMKMVADLVRRGSGDMTDHERESIGTSAQLLQLQLLSEIRQLTNLNAQILNAQAKQSLTESAAAMKLNQDLEAYRAAASGRRASKAAADPIVRELQRRPDQP